MKILIFGLPGSGKSTLAEPFANIIDAVYINADEVGNCTMIGILVQRDVYGRLCV